MRLRSVLGNLALLVATCLIMLLFLELVVFRYVFPANDLLRYVSINNVIRYVPGSKGRVYGPDGHVSQVNINADGWNSRYPRYDLAKPAGKLRIAVIGDSYVHARHVDTDEAASAVLERALQERGIAAEVLRFAIDGAPLSQHLHVLRREVLRFRPDVVIVQLIHNDFDESYRAKGWFPSAFMKVLPDGRGGFREVPPQEFRPGFADAMRTFRSFRYLYYQTPLVDRVRGLVARVLGGGEGADVPTEEMISSAVDIRMITESRKIRAVTDYIFRQMKTLAQAHDFQLLLVMDGVREAVYAGRDPSLYEVGRLNKIAASLARRHELPFLDLQEAFTRHFATHGQRFEFSWDWHWNERGHKLVGQTIARHLLELPGLTGNGAPANSQQNPHAALLRVDKG